MLSPYRVLDLSNERALICGQILADLGADVIQIEPPGGSTARKLGPFLNDTPGPEGSLYWWAYTRNKRGVTLDIETQQGRELLLSLARGAHVLIESYDPGYLRSLGLGYDDVAAVNPALVYVSVTPFGQEGPKAGYADTDLVMMAAGGPIAVTGDEDRAPLRVGVPQAYLHAGAEAAVAALIAHHERQRSGRGQHVDVSVQQAVNQAAFVSVLAAPLGLPPPQRLAGGFRYGPIPIPGVYPAKDGYVQLVVLFGSAAGPKTKRLMDYVCEEGFCDEATRDKDWIGYAELLFTGKEPMEEFDRVKRLLVEFTRSKTKDELLQAALQRGLLIAPVTRMDEVLASEQLASRDYWRDVEHPALGRTVRYPGPFAKLGETPIAYRRPPPALGEHNAEVFADAAPARDAPMAIAAGHGSRVADGALPLSDVKVLDLQWVMAGPAASRVLADYGATVLHVESSHRIDTARTMAPFYGGLPGPEASAFFQNLNAGKLGMTIDLSKEAGRAVLLDLVRWADVVMESFSPRAMPAWGLDYETLRSVKPDLIMLSTTLMGQTGPLAQFAGFGSLAAAISGFYQVTGWPDRPPAGPFGAYTDTVSPRFTAIAVLAALDYRRRTGKGQYIDQSQAEATLHFLAPALLDCELNGRIAEPMGNRDPQMAPHGVYPASDEDDWVAIAVPNDEQWRTLCDVMGRPELAGDARFATLEARLGHQDELDEIVAAWTTERDAHEVEALLQARGVPAAAVQHSSDLFEDPQLRLRGHFVEVSHPVHGTVTVENSRFRLSRTPARVERAAPTFGEHNQYVLETILGYRPERIAELAAAGVLE